MSIIKIKTKGQVTLPTVIRKQAGLSVGDVLKASFEKGNIVLTPQTLIDRRIAEGLEDIKQGRVYGPFNSPEEMITSLKQNIAKRKKKTKRA
jgi:bifunctional DNA-binding transcriptional regulator/antitoxin component of YhaV-PrlF toxin-antitoxin module